MLIVSKALLISIATVIVRVGGPFGRTQGVHLVVGHIENKIGNIMVVR